MHPLLVTMLFLHLLPGRAEERRVVAISRPSVIRIPAGEVSVGMSDRDLDVAAPLCAAVARDEIECTHEAYVTEMPSHRVHISEFGIDRTEVPQRAYRRCVVAGVCAPAHLSDSDARVSGDELPVVGVSYHDAQRYCAFVSGRLPTEAQWERAARGDGSRSFPWGHFYNPRLANHTAGHGDEVDDPDGYRVLAPVGSFPDGRSPFGVEDMAGNVYEWTADYFSENYYSISPRVDPAGPLSGGVRVIRGGSWHSPSYGLLIGRRGRVPENTRDIELGFRCAYD